MFKSIRGINKNAQEVTDRIGEYIDIFKPTTIIGKLQVDEVNELFRITGLAKPILKYDELIEYSLVEDNEEVTSGGLGIGRAIVGGTIAGGIGALLGGLTKKRTTKKYITDLHIELTYTLGDEVHSETLSFIDRKTKHNSSRYKKELDNVERALVLLDEMNEVKV